MSNQLKFLILYGLSGALIWLHILPSYNGSGYSLYTVVPLVQKNEDLARGRELQMQAKELFEDSKNFNEQYAAFKNEDRERLAIAIPQGLDGVRLLNEIVTLSDDRNKDNDMEVTVVPDIHPATSDGKSQYSTTNLQIQFSGAYYEDLKFYLETLQKNLRILNLKGINLALDDTNKLSGSITLNAYYYPKKDNTQTQPTTNTVLASDTNSNSNTGVSKLDAIINSGAFREVDAISNLTKIIGNSITVHPLLNMLNDSTIKIERQKITQGANPFINKFKQ